MARTRRKLAAPSPLDRKYLARSISLPVQECLSHDWRDFERLICDSWHHSTCLANWAAHTLRLLDVVRTPAMKELPPLQKVDLYALAFGRAQENVGREFWQCAQCKRKWHPSQVENRLAPEHERGKQKCAGSGQAVVPLPRALLPLVEPLYEGRDFWQGAKTSAVSILRKVQSDYVKYRGKIVFRRERRTPEYLYPYPFPVHQQSWVGDMMPQGRPVIYLGLPGGRVSLRLRNGPEFASKLRVFQQIAAGEIKQRQLILDAQSSRAHCRLVHAWDAKAGQTLELRLLARIAYDMEVAASFGTGQTALLRTGKEPFLTLEIPGQQTPSVWYCPWVQQWIAEHRRFLDRFADDLKFEKRWPRRKRARRDRRQTRGCELQDNRMKSFRQETAHQVVCLAKRQGCDRIVYDDSDRKFADEFPWFLFEEALQAKCDEFAVVLEKAASGFTNNEKSGENNEHPRSA